MSRDDLAGLERRGRRRGWMARAAKAFAWLTGAGALGAAVVITVRTVSAARVAAEVRYSPA